MRNKWNGKFDWQAMLFFIVCIILLYAFVFWLAHLNDQKEMSSSVVDSICTQEVSQLPSYPPQIDMTGYETVDLTPYAIGGGVISTAILGVAGSSLKEQRRQGKDIAVLKSQMKSITEKEV